MRVRVRSVHNAKDDENNDIVPDDVNDDDK